MLKYMIPALAVSLIGNSLATAQYFGTKYPAASTYTQPARPIRIAQVTSPSDSLDELDALDDLDAPASADAEDSIPKTPERSILSPSMLEPPASLDVPDSLDMPEQLELPQPSAAEPSENVRPEISAQDLDSLEPSQSSQAMGDAMVSPMTPIPAPIDFNHAIEQQQRDLRYVQQHTGLSQYYSGTHHAALANPGMVSTECGCNSISTSGCGSCLAPMAYRAPILPSPNSFRGHFRSNPCYFDLWANYSAEAAADCAHNRAKLASPKKSGCQSCELVDPCPCR